MNYKKTETSMWDQGQPSAKPQHYKNVVSGVHLSSLSTTPVFLLNIPFMSFRKINETERLKLTQSAWLCYHSINTIFSNYFSESKRIEPTL